MVVENQKRWDGSLGSGETGLKEVCVILNAGGMLRELQITDVSWETIPDGRSSCTETTSTN